MENTAARMTVAEEFRNKLLPGTGENEIIIYTRPHTWNQAAQQAVVRILGLEEFAKDVVVDDVRKHINLMIEEMGPQSTKQISPEDAANSWAEFGAIAAAAGETHGIFNNLNETFNVLVKEISTILVKKQRDYGHENIARFGRIGLLVRCHDKVARLENLLSSGNKPENETIVDNFIDVIGYSAIGYMWESGTFLLPLE